MSFNQSVIHNADSNDAIDEEFFDVNELVLDPDAPQASHVGREQLEKCGHWLLSIPRDNFAHLRTTPEYGDFLRSFEKLGQAHRRVLAMIDTDLDKSIPDGFSFLQHMAVDDVVLRVFELLDCLALVRTSQTCSRFRELAHRSATQRTFHMAKSRQLDHVMKLLRAKEEMDGTSSCATIIEEMNNCHVPVPMLGLEKRVIVTGAGDPEFNGVYHCTGCNGNGFVFTKPRNRVARARSISSIPMQEINDFGLLDQLVQNTREGADAGLTDPGNCEIPTKPGELLRCTIAKRYSNMTLLWYMSKEVEDDNNGSGPPQITPVFLYWASLSPSSTDELSSYPSQTSSMISSGEESWQSLSDDPVVLEAPTVEVFD